MGRPAAAASDPGRTRRCPTAACRVAALALGLLLVLVAPRPAAADGAGILFAPTYADPDLREEAGALSLLVRGALDADGTGLVAPYELVRRGVAPSLARAREVVTAAKARFLVVSDLDRLGPTLLASAHVLDHTGSVVAKISAVAPEGAIDELADELARALAPPLGLRAGKIPDVAVGQLRPFFEAERQLAAGRPADAARALTGGESLVALRVPAAAQLARVVAADASLALPDRAAAAAVAGTPREVFLLTGADKTPAVRALRALAHVELADATRARAELIGILLDPATALARAALGQLEQRADQRDAAIRTLLASTPSPAALRWLSRLAPGALGPELERAVLAAAARTPQRRFVAALGLRAAEAGVEVDAALALIAVTELDKTERARLGSALGRASGAEADRLVCELAMVRGDISAAQEAVARLARSGDPRAALYRGRVAWQIGDLAVAADELSHADAPLEAARVLLVAGDPRGAAAAVAGAGADGSASRIGRLVSAEVALAEARPEAAVAALREAEALAPGSRAVQARLGDALDKSGDASGAAEARARAVGLVEPPAGSVLAASATSAAVAGASATAGSGAAGSGAPDGAAAAAAALAAAASNPELLRVLTDLLGKFPQGTFMRQGVVLAAYGGTDPWWSPRVAKPEVLVAHLSKVLSGAPFEARLLGRGLAQPEPAERTRLAELASASNAALVVLYKVRASGAITLLMFDARSGQAMEAKGQADPDAAGLRQWNRWLVGAGAAVLGLALLWFLLVVIRGHGTVEIRVGLDPSGTDEVLCVELSTGKSRPRVGDPQRFVKEHRAAGQKVSKNRITLANASSKLRAQAGTYWVHVWGVYQRAGQPRMVDDLAFSQEIEVMRRGNHRVDIDLAPRTAELRIKVVDAKAGGIAVWLDASTVRLYTSDAGEVTMQVPLGAHTLHFDADGLHVEKQLSIATPKVEQLEVNLIRERRLADVSGGLTLQKQAVTTFGPAQPSGRSSRDLELATAAPTVPEPAARPTDGAWASRDEVAIGGGGAGATQVLPAGGPGMAVTASPIGDRAAPIAGTPTPGEGSLLLGRYRISRILGQGAMGVVFRATDQNLEREVAVKAMSRDLRRNPDALRFFIEEAKALAQLNHPNIVSVFDQTHDGDETYLIMEFVDGRTLDEILQERGRLPVPTALALIDQLCAGLAYVHSRRVIHRDIKPANIFVSSEKVVKLGDFGLARVMRELSIRRTEIRGTPLYMAPEQITGQNVTHRVDLYAVGCTLFELVTGRPPFIEGEILIHHLATPPPVPSSLEPSVPPALDELILACIEKEQDARIESAGAIRDRIRAIAR